MSAVAWLLASAGVPVTGSDAAKGPYLAALRDAGLDVRVGHDPALVAGAAAVVVTSAVRESNPELVAARQFGIPVWHRSEALVRAVAGKRLIAVAGAHGKTTTSAMTAHALRECGIDATFAIGAPVLGVPGAVGGAYAGASDVAVIEADESDGSFLAYRPQIAIITNVEADHLDHYGTVEAVEEAFRQFAASAALVIACGDDTPAGLVATDAAGRGVPVVTYGTGEADVTVDATSVGRGAQRFAMAVSQPGAHNRLNAAGAWAAAVAVGADPLAAAAAMGRFPGTGRRYELRGEAGGVRVVDDYAHHPTEIAALLAAAREREPGRLVVLFQPHLYSRTRLLAPAFARALDEPGAHVIVSGIYGAREDPEPGVGPRTITDLMGATRAASVEAIEDLRSGAERAAELAEPGDTILTVGAGSVTDIASRILDRLRTRARDRA
jgi:UDP-N-acetylmuramate--alanine ligase